MEINLLKPRPNRMQLGMGAGGKWRKVICERAPTSCSHSMLQGSNNESYRHLPHPWKKKTEGFRKHFKKTFAQRPKYPLWCQIVYLVLSNPFSFNSNYDNCTLNSSCRVVFILDPENHFCQFILFNVKRSILRFVVGLLPNSKSLLM